MSSKKPTYMAWDYLVHKEEGWTEREYQEILDKIIEIVEEYNGAATGSSQLLTEEEVDQLYEDATEKVFNDEQSMLDYFDAMESDDEETFH